MCEYCEKTMKKKTVNFRFGLDEPPDWVKKELEPVPILPDEVSDWAKEAAKKIMATPPSIRRKIEI